MKIVGTKRTVSVQKWGKSLHFSHVLSKLYKHIYERVSAAGLECLIPKKNSPTRTPKSVFNV
jgi:hypothetical protein